MPIAFDSLSALLNHGFDTVIDVRSPAEYAEDHIPGAVNMPALSNAERAEVGTIYKQVSAFDARKIGAVMVARNAAAAIETRMQDKDGSWKPLVYCWRGGQRSGSFSSILAQIGWRTDTIKGGYQSFRRLVHKVVYDDPLPHRFVLLDGYTGTAKTDLLPLLPQRGVQMLDLEGIARHRGSLLGAMPGGQPAQKAFETQLAVALTKLDPARPVVVEAESSKIGRLNIPPRVWERMVAAPRIVIEAPVVARAAYLTAAYADVIANPDDLTERLRPLRFLRGHDLVDGLLALLSKGDHVGLATALIDQHYDAAYAKSRKLDTRDLIATLPTETLDPAALETLADRIAGIMAER